MSDREEFRLNRRHLLAAISTVGAVGALTGRGTAAYLTDRETFADNRMTAGSVTLALDGADARRVDLFVAVDDYGFENRDTETVCLGLGDESNPGWVWVRACPTDPVADALGARLRVDGQTVYMGSLGGLLGTLAGPGGDGVLLTSLAGDGAPVTPGPDGAVCLTVDVWAPTALADDPGTVRALKAASPFAVSVDAYAEQSRHVSTPRRPVIGENPSFTFPPCTPTGGGSGGGDDGDDGGYAISNVSLCTSSPVDPGAVTWTVRDPATGADATGAVDEAFVVTVTAPVPIQYAVVKAGREFRRFDVGGTTTVTVSSTGGTLLDAPANFSQCACEGVGAKLDDWNGSTGTFDAVVALSCDDEKDRGGPPANGPGGPTTTESTGSDAPDPSGASGEIK
jgi:predicted ribosomally synthesized peptide with SipW-like signal peptide